MNLGRNRRVTLPAMMILSWVLVAAACGGDDGADDTTADESRADATTVVEAAGDGTTTTASTGDADAIVPGEDPDVDAVVAAYRVVFDSETGIEEKTPHLEQADELASTIEEYGAAGVDMGGIALVPIAVEIDGDVAAVTYDVLFGGNVAYSALEGEAVLIDGMWTVTRDEFCGFMASARTPCP